MGQFADAIKSFQVRSLASAEKVRKDVIFDLFSAIIFNSAVDTGNFMANWNTSQNSPDLSFSPWGNGRNNSDSERLSAKSGASSVALARVTNWIGDGLKKDTKTFLSNAAVGIKGDAYGWKIEYGYPHYAWNSLSGKTPPSENVLASGYSRHAPKGMVRINVAKFHEIVRKSVRRHAL